MALSDYITNDLFRTITETGQEGSRALFDTYLGNRYKDWGGAFSPPAQSRRQNFDPIWQQYLGEILSATPSLSGPNGLNAPHMAGRQGFATPPSFQAFLGGRSGQGNWLKSAYANLPQAQRGVIGSRLEPIVKRER